MQQLNGSTNDSNGTPKVIGALWSEWGDMGHYTISGAEFVGSEYFSSEQNIDVDGNSFNRIVNH